MGEEIEHILTIVGSLLLLTAHVKNIRVRHGKCETKCESTHDHKENLTVN